jgi:hypothetical protein
MKNLKTILIAASLCMLLPVKTKAQKRTTQFNLNYNYSIPTGAFKSDLVSDNSPRGGRGSILYFFNNRFAAGLESGYQDYYQKYPRSVYSLGKSQDVSAVITNSIQTIPFIVKAKYFPLAASGIRPYVSVGAGGNLIDFKQYLGEFGSQSSSVGFLAQGGVGIMVPFGRFSRSGLNIGASYDYAPYTKYNYHNLNSLNVQGGVVFSLD